MAIVVSLGSMSLFKYSALTLSLGACEANGFEFDPPGGSIPAAIAAADGGGRTVAFPLAAAAAGDLLRSRLLFRGMLIFTYSRNREFC